MRVIFLGLALFCVLGAGAATSVPATSSTEQKPSTPHESALPTDSTPTVANTTDGDDNSTVPVLQITDYHYFDWPKIGYQIFMEKMLDALKTLKFFLSLDPMLLKITRTYILTNDTDLDFGNNNSTDVNSNEISSEADQSHETNTESPLMIAISGKSESNVEKDKASIKEESKDHSEESKDDVKKTKTEAGGFFSSIAGAVASFYHAITGWF